MHNKAKAVDILPVYSVGFGLIVNKIVKEIFKSHELPPHAFYPMKIYHNNKILEYFWFHYIPNDFWELLDLEKSYAEVIEFNKSKVSIKETIPIIFRDQIIKEKYRHKAPSFLRLGEIKLDENFLKYDFYRTDVFYHTIISEKLKTALKEVNITGYQTKLFDKIVFS